MVQRMLPAILLVAAAATASAQLEQDWVQRYNGPAHGGENCFDVDVDELGFAYLTGWSEGVDGDIDIYTMKVAPIGMTMWVQRYDGLAHADDMGFDLQVDRKNGGVVVVGSSEGSGTGFDYLTLRYDAQGTLLWERRYDGGGADYAWGTANLALDANGNAYVTGMSQGAGPDLDAATVAYAPDGTQLWVQRYAGPASGNDFGYSIAVDGQGDVCVLVQTNQGTPDMSVFKYAPDGTLLWNTFYDGPAGLGEASYDLATDAAGNVYVTGIVDTGPSSWDVATLKIDAGGTLVWDRFWNAGNDRQYGFDVAVDPGSGNVAVTGSALMWGGDDAIVTLLYDAGGNLLWARYHENGGFYGDDTGNRCEFDDEGNVWVAGTQFAGWFHGNDAVTVQYAPHGTLLWEGIYDGPARGQDGAWAMHLDPSGGALHIAGGSLGLGTGLDAFVARYGLQTHGATDDPGLSLR